MHIDYTVHRPDGDRRRRFDGPTAEELIALWRQHGVPLVVGYSAEWQLTIHSLDLGKPAESPESPGQGGAQSTTDAKPGLHTERR